MPNLDKLIQAILSGRSDNNISFSDLQKLFHSFGFQERIRGDHHIFTKEGIAEIINIQPKGNKAKSYQVKQAREIILRYKLEV